MNDMRKLMEAVEQLEEANQGGKTEHSGAKKGKGAYYGRKKEAKRDSNKNRRNADKASTKNLDEGATRYTRQYGPVTAYFDEEGGEVLLRHGHNENLFLSMEEWKEFAGEIQDIMI